MSRCRVSVTGSICLPDIPPPSVSASDYGESQTNVNNTRAAMTPQEVTEVSTSRQEVGGGSLMPSRDSLADIRGNGTDIAALSCGLVECQSAKNDFAAGLLRVSILVTPTRVVMSRTNKKSGGNRYSHSAHGEITTMSHVYPGSLLVSH